MFGDAGDSQRNPASPRAALAADLGRHLSAMLAAADLDGARLVNETIGRLLMLDVPHASGATVVSLAAERAKRER